MNAPHNIRRAQLADAKSISQLVIPLVEEFISYEYTEQGAKIILASMSEQHIASNINQSYEYFVAESEDSIVGVLGIRDGNHIFHCFVDKQYHGKRIGKQLWNFWLAKNHVARVTVNSSKFAVDFYKSLGFTSEDELFEKNGITCYPMILEK